MCVRSIINVRAAVKDNTSLCVCFPSLCASAGLGKQLMSAGMDHLGTSFHVGVSPQSKSKGNFPKHIKRSYANGLWQRSCGCIVVLICIHCGSSWQGPLFAFALYLRGSSPDYIIQSQHRDIRHGLAANAGANPGVK